MRMHPLTSSALLACSMAQAGNTTIVAGTGTASQVVEGFAATASALHRPFRLAVNGSGTLRRWATAVLLALLAWLAAAVPG